MPTRLTLGRACVQLRLFSSSPTFYDPKTSSDSASTSKQSKSSTKQDEPDGKGKPSPKETQKSKAEDNPILQSARKSMVAEKYTPIQGSLGDSSILDDTVIREKAFGWKEQAAVPAARQDEGWVPSERVERFDEKYKRYALTGRNAHQTLTVIDPSPPDRLNFEREKIINHVRSDWKISKDDHLKRTERSIMVRSLDLKTSRKKLGKLARQIAGKTIDEALLQMRFSKKRVAGEVIKHLEHARNLAIVERGMGLGKPEGRMGEKIRIRLKDGSQKKVEDRTQLYIDQAWVGRGEYELEMDHRARGRGHLMKKVYTSESCYW
jgi:ribosomal protein L22